MRVDLYSLIHKAQRFHLFALSNAMATTDFADASAAGRVRARLRGLIAHLRDHAKNEETYIHPLYKKIGDAADGLDADHHRLDDALSALEERLRKEEGPALFAAYTRFLADYLAHLDDEERAQEDILWKNHGDDALGAVFARFKAERAPAAAEEDLAFMLPALNVPELIGMFNGIKASAPAAAFEGACALAEKTLDAAVWRRVASRLG